jgi:hypothetical protein
MDIREGWGTYEEQVNALRVFKYENIKSESFIIYRIFPNNRPRPNSAHVLISAHSGEMIENIFGML